jgi:hypothetical protein
MFLLYFFAETRSTVKNRQNVIIVRNPARDILMVDVIIIVNEKKITIITKVMIRRNTVAVSTRHQETEIGIITSHQEDKALFYNTIDIAI